MSQYLDDLKEKFDRLEYIGDDSKLAEIWKELKKGFICTIEKVAENDK